MSKKKNTKNVKNTEVIENTEEVINNDNTKVIKENNKESKKIKNKEKSKEKSKTVEKKKKPSKKALDFREKFLKVTKVVAISVILFAMIFGSFSYLIYALESV